MRSQSILSLLIACILLTVNCRAQLRGFPEIERSYGATVLVSEVATGRIVGGVRTSKGFEQLYHPASVFKLVIAATALRSGGVKTNLIYTCTGIDTINGKAYRCWNRKGHGKVDLTNAIAHSCNLYFRRLSTSISKQVMIQTARSLGMLSRSGFPGSSETIDIVELDDANLLGTAFRVSPAQMLRTALILAWRGGRGSSDLTLASGAFSPIYAGMRRCVSKGTGRAAWRREYSIAGKTGTDRQPGSRYRSIGWFIGFAPADHPRYAISVMFPNGQGSDAAVVAGKVLDELL